MREAAEVFSFCLFGFLFIYLFIFIITLLSLLKGCERWIRGSYI